MKKVIATICSREKKPNKELLAAKERYLGAHVKAACKVAKKEKKECYIFSGLYGLIPAETKIPDYDYFISEDVVEEKAEKLKEQLKEFDITEIDLYTKEKWVTYNQAIKMAAKAANIKLTMREIEE